MIRNKKLWFILPVILFATLIIVIQVNRRGAFGRKNTDFAIPEDTNITMIELLQGPDKIVLQLEEDGWKVNDAGEVRKSAISFMIQTLKEIAIKSPVSDELFSSEITGKGVEPVRVKVWSGNRIVNSFLVFKTGSNIYGNIMKKRSGSKPFIVSIPGFEGAIGSNFNMNELFWVPFNIFRYSPGEINSVEVQYTTNPEESFIVRNPDTADTTGKAGLGEELYDKIKIRRYLSYYTWVPFESWAFDLREEEAEMITAGAPLATVALTLKDGTGVKLTLWERVTQEGGLLKTDTDRAWGRKDEGPLFIVRYFDVDPLLRRKSYFFRDE
jgi:hypothetical protein